MRFEAVTRSRYLHVIVVVLLLTSGCAGIPSEPQTESKETRTQSPLGTETNRDTARPQTVSVSGGSFEFDADRTWEIVQAEFGPNVSAPSVTIESLSSAGKYTGGHVYIDSDLPHSSRERTLVHEFGHHILTSSSDIPNTTSPTIDERFAYGAYQEGFAEYVERWYLENHLPGVAGERNLPTWAPEERWLDAKYTLGYRYVDYRINHDAELGPIKDGRWPNTTEQILHPERGFESVKPLSVRPADVNVEGRVAYVPTHRERRLGELAVRIALWSRTNDSVATRGASGWGNDRLLRFQSTDGDGFAWVIRYDNASAARQGREAFHRYHNGTLRSFSEPGDRAERTAPTGSVVDAIWRADGNRSFDTAILGDETLVVYAGPESFVANAEALGSAGNVTIRVANRTNSSRVRSVEFRYFR